MTQIIRKFIVVFMLLLGLVVFFRPAQELTAELQSVPITPSTVERPSEENLYAEYSRVLSKFVDDKGLVYYEGLKESQADLDTFMRKLATLNPVHYEQFSESEKIAFWSNAYNGLTLKAIVDNYPIKSGFFSSLAFPKNSIRQISGVWDKLAFQVMGKPHTLNQIEHEILRKDFTEPGIHMALVCAALSCPRLRNEPYYGPRLEEQLADQAREFLTNETRFAFPKDDEPLGLSKIFSWFGGDFVAKYEWKEGNPGYSEKEGAIVNYVAQHLSEDKAKLLREKSYTISYLDYDWTLNERTTPISE